MLEVEVWWKFLGPVAPMETSIQGVCVYIYMQTIRMCEYRSTCTCVQINVIVWKLGLQIYIVFFLNITKI